jgi:hypothetical protein
MLKPWQAPLNKAPSEEHPVKRVLKNKEREDPRPSQKSKTQSGSQGGKGTKYVPEPLNSKKRLSDSKHHIFLVLHSDQGKRES